jgi:dolichol-phosphate mannosyltransferase
MKKLILIGTFNEAENIGALLGRLREIVPDADILVVDDRSPDGTGRIVKRMGAADPAIHLLERHANPGYGFSMLDGFRWALDHGAERLATLDADFSHDPEVVPALFAALDRADVALGSRYVGGVRVLNWEVSRLILSISANQYVRLWLRFPYMDCTSGFRAYRAEALRTILKANISSRGYSFLVEILFWTHHAKMRVKEVPIVYSERRLGQSKMSKKIIFEAMLNPFRLWMKWLRRG